MVFFRWRHLSFAQGHGGRLAVEAAAAIYGVGGGLHPGGARRRPNGRWRPRRSTWTASWRRQSCQAWRSGGDLSIGAAPAVTPAVAADSRAAAGSKLAEGPGGNWHGGGWRRHGGGFWPGVAVGAAIGGLGSYAYYGGGYYNDPYYYGDDSYYDEPSVAVVPDSGGDSAAYCAQRYRSYDPASGTYPVMTACVITCP